MSDNSFYINCMTRAFYRLVNSQISGKQIKGAIGFQDYAAGLAKETDARQEIRQPDGPETENMTLDEYKQYIYNRISQIPLHPSQMLRTVQVNITDQGFEAMQQDKEYEKWVLDTLKSNFSYHDPWAEVCGGSFAIHRFGVSKEEYRGDSWYTGFQGKSGNPMDEEESFWERRMEKQKQYIEQQQERMDETKLMRRIYREAALRRGDIKGMLDADAMTQTFSAADLLSLEGEARKNAR